ncbi:hypothetical protein L9F63_016856 [Diploptera punctata]|uniref:CRAL-TRIO domain-containing protein n=1 Tax=Diploptera punctata TaxID=6984 RepID=A0AAD8A0A0_DIPPU|nr:hypothetical protein L9F63_016856 [Diploptera punctata]
MPPITADEELSKNIKLKRENIEHLREWLMKQPHLPNSQITDEQLILFLHSCQHSLEASKQTIEAYYSIRTHAPELFGNRDTNYPPIKQALSIIEIAAMPKRDQHGNVVMLGRLSDTDSAKFSYDNCLNCWFMLMDIKLLEEGAVPGYVFMFDMKGVSLRHVTGISLTTLKKYFMYIQDAFPGIVVANHMLNATAPCETFLSMCKPFMRKELLSKLHVHTSMNTVYEHVPKEVLPKEYGGKLDSISIYSQVKNTLGQLDKYKDWLKKEETIRVDESKRPGKAKDAGDVFGVEGSFKKLDID